MRSHIVRAEWRERLRVMPTRWQLLQLIERSEVLELVDPWFVFREMDTGRRYFVTKHFQSQWLIPAEVRQKEGEEHVETRAQRRMDESELTHTVYKIDAAHDSAPWECWACMCANEPADWPSCASCGHNMSETALHAAKREAKSASNKAAKMAALRGQKAVKASGARGPPQDRMKPKKKAEAEAAGAMKVLRKQVNAAFGRKHLSKATAAMNRDAVAEEISADEARRWLKLPLLEGRLSHPIVAALASVAGVTLRGGKVVEHGPGGASPLGFGERGGAGLDASPGALSSGLSEAMMLAMTPDGMTPAEAVAAGLFFTPDNGDGRRILPSGAVYSGTFANKQFDGQGEMRWPAPISATYTGQWRAGLRDGEGAYVQQPGGEESGRWLRYEGQWRRGMRHGTAVMSSSNGEHFEGQFENGAMTGDGVLRTATGDVYEGQWKDGAYDGVGTFTIPSIGYEYTGEVVKGEAQGTGVERVGTGEVYRGQFHNDRRHGKGSALFPTGDAYRGQWYRGQFHGVGEYITAAGSTYRGQWEASLRKGFGKALLANGDAYTGQWKADVAEGDGECYFAATGDVYRGRWKGGLRHGRGQHVMGVTRPESPPAITVSTENVPVAPRSPRSPRTRTPRSGSVSLPPLTKTKPMSLKLQRRRDRAATTAAEAAQAAAEAAEDEATFVDMTPEEFEMYRRRVKISAARARFDEYFETPTAEVAAAAARGRYDGMWHDGVASGKGQMWYENMDHYAGQVRHGPQRAKLYIFCSFAFSHSLS